MTSKKNLSLPWTLRKHKGSVACYSDIVNASGYPLACVHDDYAAAIVDAVNGQAPQEATEPRCENCHEILPAHVSCNYCGHPQRPHEPTGLQCEKDGVCALVSRNDDEWHCTACNGDFVRKQPVEPGAGWIAVTDRLPEWTEDRRAFVLVYSDSHDWQGTQFAVMRQSDFWDLDPEGDGEPGTDDARVVTHWKELRAPSTKGGAP